jgi:hypothetical protein
MSPEQPRPDDADAETPEPPRARRPGSAGQAKQQGDGRHDREQLKKNQERLGVGTDHRTAAMKKGRRGTFP